MRASLSLTLLIAAVPAAAAAPVVRVVTISGAGLGGNSPKERLAETIARLDQAAGFAPDLAVLSEDFTRGPPEAAPGPTTAALAAWAREHRSYVVVPLRVRAGGHVFNSAVILDRKGGIAGRYDKAHPSEPELQKGTSPGPLDPPVFETDFGRIGLQICFDVNWRDTWMRLRAKGADLVLWPSAYPATTQIPALAWQNQLFVVTSTARGPSRIYDVTGEIVAASAADRPWAGAALPLGRRLFETDFNVQKMRAVEQKYGARVEVKWYDEDSWITLASLDPGLRVEDLIEELGLTPLDRYLARATRAQDAIRRGASEASPGRRGSAR